MLFIFDMGGVVTTTATPGIFQRIADYLHISLEDFYKYSPKELLLQYEKGLITSKEYWESFNKASGLKVKSDLYRLMFHPELKADTVELITKLKSKGHRVVCGTNTNESHYDNHLCRGDYAFFPMTYASHHMGIIKPDVEFFKMIMDAEGYKPSEVFFTDDKLTNINAAKECGINAYLFDNAEGFESYIESIIGKL